MATKGNYITIVEKLLEKSPNINTVDKDGMTALFLACKDGYQDIAFMLLNAGAYTNLQDRSGDTNLIHACKFHTSESGGRERERESRADEIKVKESQIHRLTDIKKHRMAGRQTDGQMGWQTEHLDVREEKERLIKFIKASYLICLQNTFLYYDYSTSFRHGYAFICINFNK